MTFVVRTPSGAQPERRYALEVVLGEWLGLTFQLVDEERRDVSITCGSADGELLLPEVFFSTDFSQLPRRECLPSEPLPTWFVDDELQSLPLVDRRLPVLFGRECAPGTFLRSAEGRVELGLDVFGSTFFMLSRYEEAVPGSRDEHDRFPPHESLAERGGFADRPIINEYVEVLWRLMRRLWPRLERGSRAFRFLPTHDVDRAFCREQSPFRLLARLGLDVMSRRDLELAARRILAYRRGPGSGPDHDLCDTYSILMELSEAAGTASAFHFFGELTDAGYAPSDPPIRKLFRMIGERGHHVALHASYDATRDAAVIQRQFDALRSACEAEGVREEAWGSRHHYLRWETPVTWQALDDAGLCYDSTLCFSAGAGFRAGCCHEFPVFNVLSRRTLTLRERPLIAMEVALLDRLGLTHGETLEYLTMLRDRCKLFAGDFTLLWHNSRLQTRADREAYEAFVRAAA